MILTSAEYTHCYDVVDDGNDMLAVVLVVVLAADYSRWSCYCDDDG